MKSARLLLPDALRAELFVHAREALPEEACGFLIGTERAGVAASGTALTFRVRAVRPTRNLHPQRIERFLMDPLEYQKAEAYAAKHADQGYRILGFWHSHPKGPPRPSARDREEALGLYRSFPSRYLYLILAPNEPEPGALACWRLDQGGTHFAEVEIASKRRA